MITIKVPTLDQMVDEFPKLVTFPLGPPLDGKISIDVEQKGIGKKRKRNVIGKLNGIQYDSCDYTDNNWKNNLSSFAIGIYDDETKIYNEIQKNSFEVNMPVGVNNSRFSLRFKDQSLSTDKSLSVVENNTNTDSIKIAHIQNNNTLKITNNSKETTVEKVTLFNINGQTIASWKIENQDQQNIQIQINTISSGVYVAKLKTTTGELSKKLIIR